MYLIISNLWIIRCHCYLFYFKSFKTQIYWIVLCSFLKKLPFSVLWERKIDSTDQQSTPCTPLANIEITLEGGPRNKTTNFCKLWPKPMWPGEKNWKFHGGLFLNPPKGAEHILKCVKLKIRQHIYFNPIWFSLLKDIMTQGGYYGPPCFYSFGTTKSPKLNLDTFLTRNQPEKPFWTILGFLV